MDVGIIGGQDGPTAVLTTTDPAALLILLLLAAALAGTAVWFFKHKRNK